MLQRTSLLAVVVALCACSAAPSEESVGSAGQQVRVCATGPTVQGVDVSTYDGDVDWSAVAASGKAFAFARVSDGTGHPDDQFDRNWSQIASHGLVRGVYQFFRASEDPIAQADLLLSKIGSLGPDDLPPVLDLEVDDGQGSAIVVAAATKWLDRVRAATGRVPIVYTASGFWSGLAGTSAFAAYPLWIANYGATCPSMPSTWSAWTFWQYSESGTVGGISGAVDLSVFNGTLAELRAFAAAGARPAEAIAVDWTRAADGHYDFTSAAKPDVVRIDYDVDGYALGEATGSGKGFDVAYTFSLEGTGRRLEARGYDASGRYVAHGVGAIDVTAAPAAFVREAGSDVYEIGVERAPAGVVAIEARVDGILLTDSVSGATRSPRLVVRAAVLSGGSRSFAVTTYDAAGSVRGTLTRTLVLD